MIEILVSPNAWPVNNADFPAFLEEDIPTDKQFGVVRETS
jgi:hypothetical protein